MDMNTITVLLAIITIVPTVGGIIFQAIKDKRTADLEEKRAKTQEELDRINATSSAKNADINATTVVTAAQVTMITTLQGEVQRLTTRVQELEQIIIDKTAKIGELMMAKIDAESETATMKYQMERLQMKLNALAPEASPISDVIYPKGKKKEDTVPLKIKQTLIENETRKALVREEVDKEIETLKSSSIVNDPNINIPPIEGE